MTADLLSVAAWLLACGCAHVAIESTADDWKPVFYILKDTCAVILVNVQPGKTIPGRKTEVKDATWRAARLQHGLLRESFTPSVARRELRDLTRDRSALIQERVTLINRVQKLLEDAHIKLVAVALDIIGARGGQSWRPC